MTNPGIRKKLITYLADADKKKVKAVYTLLEKDIETQNNFKLSASQIKLLRADREKYLKGKTKTFTWSEVKEKARNYRKK